MPVQIALSQARKLSNISGVTGTGASGDQIYSGTPINTATINNLQYGKKRKNQNSSDLEQQIPTKLKYVKNASSLSKWFLLLFCIKQKIKFIFYYKKKKKFLINYHPSRIFFFIFLIILSFLYYRT